MNYSNDDRSNRTGAVHRLNYNNYLHRTRRSPPVMAEVARWSSRCHSCARDWVSRYCSTRTTNRCSAPAVCSRLQRLGDRLVPAGCSAAVWTVDWSVGRGRCCSTDAGVRLVADDGAEMSADCCLSYCDDRAEDGKARVDLNRYWRLSAVCTHRLRSTKWICLSEFKCVRAERIEQFGWRIKFILIR